MTIMPFEGLMSESLEDVTGTDFALEPTHSDADEAWYCQRVASGEVEQEEWDFGDWREETHDPDVPWS